MAENIKLGWLEDYDEVKFAPKTFSEQILNADGTSYEVSVQNKIDAINTQISNIQGGTVIAGAADKLDVADTGDANTPVYFKNGIPVECTSLDLNTSGNAATATKLATARTISLTGDVTGSGTFDGSGDLSITATVANNSHSHSNYLPLAGGTMTGTISSSKTTLTYLAGNQGAAIINSTAGAGAYTMLAKMNSTNGYFTHGCHQQQYQLHYTAADTVTAGTNAYTHRVILLNEDGTSTFIKLYGAVWNDYAEYRSQKEEIKPGYCVASTDNGQVYKTTEKFQACDGIVSDTFGFAIGETDNCKTPLAVAGRVLAYCEGDRYSYHSGDTVCAGPDGKVVKMTREEIREWPDRIIGIVSEIPEYKTWGTGNVAVDGRIWIKVK